MAPACMPGSRDRMRQDAEHTQALARISPSLAAADHGCAAYSGLGICQNSEHTLLIPYDLLQDSSQ